MSSNPSLVSFLLSSTPHLFLPRTSLNPQDSLLIEELSWAVKPSTLYSMASQQSSLSTMANRLESLPLEVIKMILSYVNYDDAARLREDPVFKSYDPALVYHKGRERYRAVTIIAEDQTPNPEGHAEHRCPLEALVTFHRYPSFAQSVKSLDLRPRGAERGWWYHSEANLDPSFSSHYLALGQQRAQEVRGWAFGRFVPAELRTNDFVLQHMEDMCLDFNDFRDPNNVYSTRTEGTRHAVTTPPLEWWLGRVSHFTDLFLLTAVLPNVETLCLDPSKLKFNRICRFWSHIEHICHFRGNVARDKVLGCFKRLTTFKLHLDPTLGCEDGIRITNLLMLLNHFDNLQNVEAEGLLADFGGDIFPDDWLQDSVKCLTLKNCDISRQHMGDMLDHFPNVRIMILERHERAWSYDDINGNLQDPSRYTGNGAFREPFPVDEALVALLRLEGRRRSGHLRKLRVGFDRAELHKTFGFGYAFGALRRLQVLDATANVFNGTRDNIRRLSDNLPRSLEKLKLQNITDMGMARKSFQDIHEVKDDALPNLKQLVFSTPSEEIKEFVCTECEEAGIEAKVVRDEDWVLF